MLAEAFSILHPKKHSKLHVLSQNHQQGTLWKFSERGNDYGPGDYKNYILFFCVYRVQQNWNMIRNTRMIIIIIITIIIMIILLQVPTHSAAVHSQQPSKKPQGRDRHRQARHHRNTDSTSKNSTATHAHLWAHACQPGTPSHWTSQAYPDMHDT
jgi:hypothetical protein